MLNRSALFFSTLLLASSASAMRLSLSFLNQSKVQDCRVEITAPGTFRDVILSRFELDANQSITQEQYLEDYSRQRLAINVHCDDDNYAQMMLSEDGFGSGIDYYLADLKQGAVSFSRVVEPSTSGKSSHRVTVTITDNPQAEIIQEPKDS